MKHSHRRWRGKDRYRAWRRNPSKLKYPWLQHYGLLMHDKAELLEFGTRLHPRQRRFFESREKFIIPVVRSRQAAVNYGGIDWGQERDKAVELVVCRTDPNVIFVDEPPCTVEQLQALKQHIMQNLALFGNCFICTTPPEIKAPDYGQFIRSWQDLGIPTPKHVTMGLNIKI